MLGMLGIIVQNNEIKNTTQIMQVITPGEKFLVRFLNAPAFSRVCSVEEIQSWLLFQSQEEANAWVQASAGPAPGKQPGKTPAPPATGMEKGNGALNKKDAAPPSDNDAPEETTEVEIIPAEPVTEASLRKDLEPDISGGRDPDNNKGEK